MRQCFIPVAMSFVLAVSLAACGAPQVPEQLPFVEPGVEFSVAPAGMGCTPEGAYRGKVTWDVPLSMSSKIEIQVGDERQVFARSNDSAGSEQTGVWVSEGMVFVLLDRDTDMVMGALKAGPGNCSVPGADWLNDEN